MASDAKPENVDSIILEEEIDPNYAPSEAEVLEYAKWLGMDLEKDEDLFWIAREGLKAPLPENWKPCKTKDTDDIYYFNFTTGESTWDHPCDGFYKRLYEEEKKKKEITIKENNDAKRNQAKQDAQQLLGKSDKKVKKKTKMEALEPPAPKTELAPVLDRKPLPGIKPLGPLSSNLGKLEAKPVEELSPRLNSLPSSQDLGSSMPSMKSSSKLGVIGSLRAANEQSGSSTPVASSLSSTNALDSKPLERPKYREESKPSSPSEQVAPSKGNEFEASADTKPTPTVIGSRDFGSEKVVAPETVSSYQSPTGGVSSANPFSDQQEKQLRSEIDRLNAEVARLSKKADYWEQESQNSSRKIDQNAVYYNDRINTLDSELLDARRQVVAKEDEVFSMRNSLRNAESDLSRTKDLLQSAQTDASRRQQLHADQLAVEQRKLTALETQLKEVQMTVYAKDDEIRQLKAAANEAVTTSRSSPVASSESDVAVELRAKLSSLQATIDRLESANQLQFDELRDANRKLDTKDGDVGSLTAEVERLKQQLRLASESSSSTSHETNRQVEFLQNELTQAKDTNASLSLALKQKEEELRKVQQQREQSIGEMRDKLEDAEKSKLFLTHSITEKDQELAVLRRKADLLEQSQSANEDVARYQERELRLIGQHEQEIANMRGKIDDLKHELSLLQINSASTAASLQAKNEEIESLRTLQAKLHENIKILEKERHDKDVAHLQLHTQLDAKNIEIARLQNASGQLEYFREVSRVREEEIAQLKLQLMTSVQQAQAATAKSNEAMLSPTELSELQMENSLLKTKLDTKQVELRSRTEEVHFLQEKLDAAFKDLSAAQNQARSAQSEAKAMKTEVESLQHHLQIETEATAAKDKKIRGFREELLHLQKLLSEAEQAKRRERDTSDAHTQTKAETPKEVAHVGIQKSIVAYDVGVSATQRVEQRDVGAQANIATSTAAPPAVATRVFSVQTDPVQPEVREIVRTVPVPMATAAEPQLEAVITSEMRLQMDYMREVKEELSQKMQQCNLLLSTLAARDAASGDRASTNAATATAARAGRAVQMNNFLRDTSDEASGDSPPADAATRRAPHVQIVRDDNVTPNDKTRHRRPSDRRVDETDDLDSVSDIRSPDDGAAFSLVDRLSALFTAVLQCSVGYKASTSGDSRVLHAILGGQQDATAARHAMARLAENKHRALCNLTRDFAAHLAACKDIIRHGRHIVADMKRQYARRSNSKDEINELTFDLNLAIRLARKLQETLELVKTQNKELAVDTAQLKGKSRTSAGTAVVAMAQLIVGVDRAVESFSSLATTLVNQMSRATTDSAPSPVGYADRRTLVDDTDDASDFDYELVAQTRPTPALRGRDLYPARSASPPTTRSHRHATVSGATATLRASSAHGHGGRAASLSPSRRVTKSADYRDKLDIIQHQLNSAQQKHVDSLREYDRHYKWLGSLVKEIGQQAAAPAVYRSTDGLGKAVDKARLRASVPLKAINDNILLDGSDAARDTTGGKFHFFL